MLSQINEDIKSAMKSKDKVKLDALRYLKSMLMENATSKAPTAELDVVVKQQKKLQEAIDLYPEGHEQRLKASAELAIVSEYLPKPLTESEVEVIIKDIISKLENPNMGMVMKELTPQIKGRFDGKLASKMTNVLLKK